MDAEKAYQKNQKGECNKATMRLLLDAVLKMWKQSNEHSQQLEQQLAQCLSKKTAMTINPAFIKLFRVN